MSNDTDTGQEIAEHSIAATLGVDVEVYDTDGREGVHDLQFVHAGKTVAAEAKRIVSSEYKASSASSTKRGFVPVPTLTDQWRVCVRHDASIKTAHRRLPALLRLLEDAGWSNDESEWRFAEREPELLHQLDDIGVRSLPASRRRSCIRPASA